jgi:hypothetical protein
MYGENRVLKTFTVNNYEIFLKYQGSLEAFSISKAPYDTKIFATISGDSEVEVTLYNKFSSEIETR